MKPTKPFHAWGGYLIKNVNTGHIDTDSRYPVTLTEAQNTELVEGFEWVKVKVTYEEVI